MTRRRAGCALAILLVVALAAGGVSWWRDYTRAPEYSVRMLGRAAQEGDWAGFRRYADVDRIVTQVVDAEIERRGTGPPGGEIGRRLLDAARPGIERAAKAGVREAVESRRPSRTYPTVVWALGPAEVETLSRGARTARVRAVPTYRGRRVPLVLRLERRGERWRAVAVENPGEAAAAFLRGREPRLP